MRQQGETCRIFGNLQVGRSANQVDFLLVTDHRTVLVELKTFPGPIVAAPKNGDWQVRVGGEDVRAAGNPAWQAQQATFALSDELHALAAAGRRQGPHISGSIATSTRLFAPSRLSHTARAWESCPT